jgi:TPP-dependent pyruvate/acetoin dehydrogenase alpha subunit
MAAKNAVDETILLDLYRTMVRIRTFEETAHKEFLKGEMPGFLHLYSGEEAIAVGVMSVLTPDDYVSTHHRGHGHLIAKGADTKRMFAELFGKVDGFCKGKGGSMHIADSSLNVLGANGISLRLQTEEERPRRRHLHGGRINQQGHLP